MLFVHNDEIKEREITKTIFFSLSRSSMSSLCTNSITPSKSIEISNKSNFELFTYIHKK